MEREGHCELLAGGRRVRLCACGAPEARQCVGDPLIRSLVKAEVVQFVMDRHRRAAVSLILTGHCRVFMFIKS